MARLDDVFSAELDRLAAHGLRRSLSTSTPGAARNFASNDYLGLARHPLLAERAAAYAAEYGAGATASRLVCGSFPPHAALETRLAGLKGKPSALLLGTGWQANVAVLATVLRAAGAGAQLFSDALNHNSLIQGARLAGVRARIFRHNDLAHLATLLGASPAGRKLIVTESVFSMDGDRADIAALADLAARYDAFLYVDEAHATGVLGPGGAGLCAGIPGVDVVMGTCGKALGGFGAYVAGSRALIDYLTNACAGFVFTTAPPPPVLGALDAALDLLPGMDAARARLAANAARVRAAFAAVGIDTAGSTTQIVPAVIGSAQAALEFAAGLRARGILAVAIRPPTVPEGTARIRFAVSAAHDDAAIDALIGEVTALWRMRRQAA